MKKILAIQHSRCETLGTIAEALAASQIRVDWVRTFEEQAVPDRLDAYHGLIVMGGPMSVYDRERYPFLRDEIRLIEEALKGEIPVLGVCLGSQLLAASLGAPVTPGRQKEIGWYRVDLTMDGRNDPLWIDLEPSFTAYHWHGDIFTLPAGTVSLASSELTAHQAFRYGCSAYGLLFHMEVTETMIRDMVDTFRDELRQAGLNGEGIVEQAGRHLPRLRGIGGAVFSRWAGLV
jgi:GMP synthase (glutamine-hydrolysing)